MLFHRHKWKIVGSYPVQLYGDGWGNYNDLICGYETYIALRCKTCGAVKDQTIKGNFNLPVDTDENS